MSLGTRINKPEGDLAMVCEVILGQSGKSRGSVGHLVQTCQYPSTPMGFLDEVTAHFLQRFLETGGHLPVSLVHHPLRVALYG